MWLQGPCRRPARPMSAHVRHRRRKLGANPCHFASDGFPYGNAGCVTRAVPAGRALYSADEMKSVLPARRGSKRVRFGTLAIALASHVSGCGGPSSGGSAGGGGASGSGGDAAGSGGGDLGTG